MKAGLLSVATLFLFASIALAQSDAGSISGTVSDSSGAVIPSASVIVTNLATAAMRSVETGGIGQFDIPGLVPGRYRLRVSSPSFQTYEQEVNVTVGTKTTIDVKLTVGASSQVVEVVASGEVQVNTETHELSQLIDRQQLLQLPSLTRNPYDFITISGNVSNGDNTTSSFNSGQELTSRGVGFSLNGQRQSGTEILLDGVENVAVFIVIVGQDVPVDSVREYSVVTNNF